MTRPGPGDPPAPGGGSEAPADALSRPRRQAWTSYWGQGALHSLAGSVDDGLGGEIRAFWTGAFASLGRQDRVLDIGTGNGALPALLCSVRDASTMPGIDAIDLAVVAPKWLESAPPHCRDAIRFHGETAAEALPFAEDSFTLGISQYGLEYTRTDESVAELGRVIRPGGRIALVLHHAQSRLAEVAREEVRLTGAMLEPGGLMDRARTLYPFLALAARQPRERLAADPQADDARRDFNRSMRAAQALAESSPFPDVVDETRGFVAGQVRRLLQEGHALEAVRQSHAERVEALRHAAFRSSELCTHALTSAEAAKVAELFRGNGFEAVELACIHHETMLVGWTLRARTARAGRSDR